MQTQWCLVDRSRPKRSNEEGTATPTKRQRRVRSQAESSDECEDPPEIRGGLARPRPPRLGPPPNRATNSASKAKKKTPTENTAAPRKTPQSKIRIVESDEDVDDVDWRPKRKVPTKPDQSGTTGVPVNNKGVSNPPKQPPQVGNTTAPLPPVQVPPHLPTPPDTGPSNQAQGVRAGSGTGKGGPGGSKSTTTPTVTVPPFPQESEIIQLYSKLQEMVLTWVEECLPDTFPPDFQTEHPESYWDLCGWCRPMDLGNLMLSDRAWAKYVYESWVWRFLYGEIFQPSSLTWAGNDEPIEEGGAGGAGRAMNALFQNLYYPEQRTMTPSMYQNRIQNRAVLMQQIRDGLVKRNRHNLITGWLVTEMLAAFHPYFSDSYKPIDKPQNIEVLIRDTRFLVVKARQLDEKLRSARHMYDLILGRDGEVCRISGVRSPAIQRYEFAGNDSKDPHYFHDDTRIALIVVPGLIRYDLEDELYSTDDKLTRAVVRHAKAFAQTDVFAALSS